MRTAGRIKDRIAASDGRQSAGKKGAEAYSCDRDPSGENGEQKRSGNLIIAEEQCELIAFPYIGGSYSGTGDLFASIIAGGVWCVETARDLCMLAGRFVEATMRDSAVDQVEGVAGTEFEQHHRMLLPEKYYIRLRLTEKSTYLYNNII